MNIYLIGLPGSGKSTIAKSLAGKLNKKHIDLDSIIELNQLMFIDEIFEKYDEEYFRRIETNTLSELENSEGDAIISTGGGIVLNKANKKIMKGYKIYIDTKVSIIKERLKNDYVRPVLKTNSIDQIYDNRFLKYQDFADIIISNNSSVDDCVDKIIKVLKDEKII